MVFLGAIQGRFTMEREIMMLNKMMAHSLLEMTKLHLTKDKLKMS
jgi:hypothetical protein